ncbi:MAG TPA: LysR family transcriptional regulator [Phycisphaerales bacterium]|nr:LysR family transcriptional regulator [Phycisphaerales bacterium]
MELTALRQFVLVARTGHMTRAAAALGVTQPALSAMLRKLELEAGAELMVRTGKGVELTEAGRVFFEHASDAVRRADGAVSAVRELLGLERGSIRVGGGATATTYLLPRVVRAVRASHPSLRFYVREAGSSTVASAVLTGELDLGIVTLPLPESIASELVVTPLVEDELRLILPPDGAAPRRAGRAARSRKSDPVASAASSILTGVDLSKGFRWRDLEGVPVVAFEAGTAVRSMLDQAATAAGVPLNVVMELRSIESIKRMVAAGIGVGFVSRFALEDQPSPGGVPCREGRLVRRLAIVKRRPAGRVGSARSAGSGGLSPAAAAFEQSLLKLVSVAARP